MSYQPAPGDGRIDGAHERHTSRKRLGSAGGRLLFTALIACLFALSVAAVSAQAETTLYRATQVVPVPPASDYAGSGGGDGWAVAVSDTSIYNVFHHQDSITVECHLQSNAEVCAGYPKTITDGSGNGYLSQGQPGLYLDQANGHLYVHGTRSSDDTGGVVCIDTTSSAADPFCGFTELTGPGEAPPTTSREISGLSDPVLVGTHWYSFNYVAGEHKGTENELTCFDVSTGAACAGQPYAVNFPAGTVSTSDNDPTGAIGAIGSKVIIPLNTSAGSVLACFDDATQASCGGKWPVTVPYYEVGAPYPLLDSSGNTIGVCLPTGADPCFNLEGEPVATPEGMTTAITESSEWNGTALVLGPRVYVPNGNSDSVDCYDYSTGASCVNYPKPLEGLELLYTVNPDPQRPTCIWVNSDGGQSQLQSFDAYTGQACGTGQIRVLTSQFALPECKPANYVSIQVLQPARSTYTSGSVAFADGDGNPIPGLAEEALDGTGSASLVGLPLNTSTGLPQFLFTLNGGSSGSVEIALTWRGEASAACASKVATTKTTTTTTTTTTTNKAAGGVEAFGAAHLASAPKGCIASSAYTASVHGKLIESVTFTVNGRKVGMLKKPNSHGSYAAHIMVPAGRSEKLVIHVVYTSASKVHSATLRRTIARCAVHHTATPRFTG